MANPNVVQSTVDAFGNMAGMQKHSGAWYGASAETWTILQLQKSQFKTSYYLNTGFWLKAAADRPYPKEHEFHIRARLDALFVDLESEISQLLNLETNMPDEIRSQRLEDILRFRLLPILRQGATLHGLQDMYRSKLFANAAIRGEALTALRAAPT